jgi:hypothetical protein
MASPKQNKKQLKMEVKGGSVNQSKDFKGSSQASEYSNGV